MRVSTPFVVIFSITATIALLLCRTVCAESYDLQTDTRVAMMYGGQYPPRPAGDFHGWTVVVGDVDGDGYDDLVSASIYADGPSDSRNSAGDAYLVFGGPRSSFARTLDLTAGADVTFYGARRDDFLGWSLVCGDVDGDGYDDIVLGAPHADGPDSLRFESGEAYVFFGRPRAQWAAVYDLLTDAPDVRILGPGGTGFEGHLTGESRNAFAYDGSAISHGLAIGDLNGDGRADLILSSLSGRGPQGDRGAAGEVYVVLGRESCRYPAFIDCNRTKPGPHPDIVFFGAESVDLFGFALIAVDLDGDGRDELLASALGGDGENNANLSCGDVYGWWGRRHWEPQYDVLDDAFDFAIQSLRRVGYRTGYRMVGGDLDGDGNQDLIVGQPEILDYIDVENQYGRATCGEYRIVFGGPRLRWEHWNNIRDITDTWILGADSGDIIGASFPYFQWGFSMATGDRNGDGIDDLAIGASGADGPPWQLRSLAGEAYVLYGRSRTAWGSFIDLRDGTDDIVYGAQGVGQATGAYPHDSMGFAIALGDLDGNGKDDLVTTAIFADGPDNSRPDCGEVYVVWDSDSTLVAAVPRRHPTPPAIAVDNYPNPFVGQTTVRMHGREGVRAELSVFDAAGRRVAELFPTGVMSCDEEEISWDARGDSGRALPSGVYFVRLRVAGVVQTRKITLVR